MSATPRTLDFRTRDELLKTISVLEAKMARLMARVEEAEDETEEALYEKEQMKLPQYKRDPLYKWKRG